MHELSIAMSIIEMAQEEAAQRGCHIEAVHLKLGALSGVMKDALLSSYEIASSDTPSYGIATDHRRSTRCCFLSRGCRALAELHPTILLRRMRRANF
jgi:hydrogenase nickel incorporation protein HypA/HybF